MTNPTATYTVKPALPSSAITADVSVGHGYGQPRTTETYFFKVGHHPSVNGYHVQQGRQRRQDRPTVDWERDANFPYCGKGDLARARAQGYVDAIARLGYDAAVQARHEEQAANVQARARAEEARIEQAAAPLLDLTADQWAAIQAWDRIDGLTKARVRDHYDPERVTRRKRIAELRQQYYTARHADPRGEQAAAIQAEITLLSAFDN